MDLPFKKTKRYRCETWKRWRSSALNVWRGRRERPLVRACSVRESEKRGRTDRPWQWLRFIAVGEKQRLQQQQQICFLRYKIQNGQLFEWCEILVVKIDVHITRKLEAVMNHIFEGSFQCMSKRSACLNLTSADRLATFLFCY